MRRNIVRYAVLAYVITLQRVSLRVKKRFPTWQHVVDSGECTKQTKLLIASRKKAKKDVILGRTAGTLAPVVQHVQAKTAGALNGLLII